MTQEFQHPFLVDGRWFTLSLEEQLANIGSEVHRAILSRKNEQRYWGAVSRALELFFFTIDDPRWKGRLKEILRARELFCAAALKSDIYKTTLEDLDRYFYYFALIVQSNKQLSHPS